MVRSTLGHLAQIAEIVAAAAVVISLLYVGQQVQDNTSAIRSAFVQAVANAADAGMVAIAGNEDFARIRYAWDADYDALSDLDRYRYQIYNRGQWIRLQNVYSQHQLGVLDENFWIMYSQAICQVASSSGGAVTFAQSKPLLNPKFVSYVESCDEVPAFVEDRTK